MKNNLPSDVPQTVEVNGWIMRQRIPPGDGPFPVVLMLHGWTGDENAMWIFASRLPQNTLLLAPRGLYTTPYGGYGWHPHKARAWPWVDDFRSTIDALRKALTPRDFPLADLSDMHFVGFSQGAALAFTFALLFPERVHSLVGLSGFLPDGAATLIVGQPLQRKPVFLAHGTQDKLVPVERARRAVELLQQAGAQVTYCEDDVGHKLSASCFRGLESFSSKWSG